MTDTASWSMRPASPPPDHVSADGDHGERHFDRLADGPQKTTTINGKGLCHVVTPFRGRHNSS